MNLGQMEREATKQKNLTALLTQETYARDGYLLLPGVSRCPFLEVVGDLGVDSMQLKRVKSVCAIERCPR